MSFYNNSFSPIRKLKNYKDFLCVYRCGHLTKGKFFWVYIMPTDMKQVRYGIAISKKIVKKAYARNRIKRIASEYIRQYFIPNDKSIDIVLSLKVFIEPNFSGSKELRENISSLLND